MQENDKNIDGTPERLRMAEEAGIISELLPLLLPSGMPSGGKRRVIERQLDTCLRRGWISDVQHRAGEIFRTHLVGSRLEPRVTQSWMSSIDGSRSDFISEIVANHQSELRNMIRAVYTPYRNAFLSWMIECEYRDVTICDFGSKFTNYSGDKATKTVGIHVLGMVLNDLSDHCGLKSR